MADGPVGYLVINVLESAGHDSDDQQVWEPDFKSGYARGEPAGVRGTDAEGHSSVPACQRPNCSGGRRVEHR